MKKLLILSTLFTLFCFKLTSQSLVWNNIPSPLEIELGSTLPINLSYNTSGNSFNYIWIKLQRKNASNIVLENFESIFYNGTSPVPSEDTVEISYNVSNNIPLSNELTNGEYYQLFISMWTNSNTWTGLDVRPLIVSNQGNGNSGGITKIVANLNVKHTVGGVDSFDRSKFITIHSNQGDNEWSGTNAAADLRDNFLNSYDVYMGRETGGITWHLSQTKEDPNRTGYADPEHIINRAPYWRDVYKNKNIQQYEARNNLIIAAQHHPFWTGSGQQNTGMGWKFANATAVGEYMGRYINEFHKDDGEPKPKFIEVMNEPAYTGYGGPSDYVNDIQDIAEFHIDVADAIKVQIPDAKVGGYTTAFPNFEKGDFQRWHKRWKLFIDVAGDKMDFWSIHLYDFPSIGGKKQFRSGSNIEATFDMMEQYSMLKFNKVKPFVISEYGAQTHDYNNEEWSPYRDWLHIRSSNSMLPSFLDRPNLIESTINFIIPKAEWGYTNVPYVHRLLRKENEPDSYTGDWVYTEMLKFYQLWSNIKGTRIDTTSDNLDIQVDGYVEGNKLYLILNNLTFSEETINLSFISNSETITNINKKHLYINGNSPILEIKSIAANTESVVLKSEGTMIIEITYNNSISITETNSETKYYATNYLQPITSNQENLFHINNVSASTFGEAILRIGLGRLHNLSLKPIVKFNETLIDLPDNWRGDEQSERERFFGLLEIPVPFNLLKTNNNISITFTDNGGHISSVTMQVYNFSSNIRNTTLGNSYYKTKKVLIHPNPTNGTINLKNLSNYKYVSIFDLNGSLLKTFTKNQELDIKEFSKGMYILKTDNGFVGKFLKD